jgi:Undecaprenyl-phosphate glucose phosphotransferase
MEKTRFLYKILFISSGFVLLNIAFFITFFYRFDTYNLELGYRENDIGYEYVLFVMNMIYLLASTKTSNFLFEKKNVFKNIVKLSFKDTFFIILGYALFILIVKGSWFSREFLLIFSSLFGIISFIQRAVLFAYFQYLIEKSYADRQIIIFGHGKDIEFLVKNYVRKRDYIKYLFTYDNQKENNHFEQYYLYPIEDFYKIVKPDSRIYEALIIYDNTDVFRDIYQRCEKIGIRTKIIPAFYHLIESKFEMEDHAPVPILKLKTEPLEDFFASTLKRTFDIIFSGLVLLTIFPIMTIILGIIIKFTSKGPVFFRQRRSGINQEEFMCWKFRSMEVIEQEKADKIQATKNDPRITWIGKIIRKTNIDEFPQFINVFFGEMSIVGPRPHPLPLDQKYNDTLEFYRARHHCKPGLTGWAQANGFRGETSADEQMRERIEHDLFYIYNWSFIFDIRIIFLTVWNTIKGQKNAY